MNDTPCKNCCFAVYEDLTQVGCARNRLEKYKKVGSEIIEAYDEDKEFYVIKNRICPFYRDKKWLDAFKGQSDSEIERMLTYETMSRFHLIIILKSDSTLKDLKQTVTSVPFEFLNVPPSQVTVVRPKGLQLDPKGVKELFSGTLAKWRMENLLIDRTDSQVIHNVQKTAKAQYYCVCHAGYQLPPNYFKTINKSILDNLTQFGMIEAEKDELEGVVIPLHVHEYWYFHGDKDKTIPEKIKEYQCQNQEEKIVYQLEEIKNKLIQSV